MNISAKALPSNRVLVGDYYGLSSWIEFNHVITGLATIANMGAEVGATTSTFPYTPNMRSYLIATGRSAVAHAADEADSRGYLSTDADAEYDEVIDIVSLASC